MRKTTLILRFFPLVIWLLLLAVQAQAQTNVSGSQSGTWLKANSPYVISGGITVPTGQTLTIQPGCRVIIPFGGLLTVNGTLLANGTASDSISFVGQPGTGNNSGYPYGGWISFSSVSSGSSFKYTSFDQLGQTYSSYNSVIKADGPLSLSNSSFRNSGGYSIFISSDSVSVTNCSFNSSNNSYASIYSSGTVYSTLRNCDFSGSNIDRTARVSAISDVANNTNAIVEVYGSIDRNSTWHKQGTNSYYKLEGGTSIPSGKTLTIKPGSIIRISGGNILQVYGTLLANGTASDSVYFKGIPTSNYSYGGNILFSAGSSGSSLSYASIDLLGQSYNYTNAIYANSSFSLSNSSIKNSYSYPINLNSDTISPTIQNCVFVGNDDSRTIYSNPSSVSNLSNIVNAIINLSGSVSQNSQWQKQGTGTYYKINGVAISSGKTLTIKPGSIIRISGGNILQVYGTLLANGTASDSVYFKGIPTSNYSYGGNILFNAGSSGSSLSYASIDLLGQSYNYSNAIYANSSFSLSNSSIKNSYYYPINLNSDTISPTIQNCVFVGNDDSRTIYAPSKTFSLVKNNSSAILKPNSGISSNVFWPKQGTNSYYQIDNAITISNGNTLTIDSGNVINMPSTYSALLVNGTLKAQGTQTAPIRFVKLNGSGTYGGAVVLNANSSNNILTYCSMDKQGGYYGSPLSLYTANATITNLSVSNSQNYGVYILGASPMFTGANITNNSYGVYVASGSPIFNNCNITSNTSYGVFKQNGGAVDTVDARNCYWGDASGPNHPALNPSGTGNKVSDRVKFVPWNQQAIRVNQTISLAAVADKYMEDTVKLGGSASSGLPVSYSIVTSPATGVAVLSGDTITFLNDTGRVTITATQAGDAYFFPAPVQTISFKVQRRSQSITFSPVAAKTFGDSAFALRAMASSGLPIQFSIVSGPATLSQDSVVSLTGAGTVTVKAAQAGNRLYFLATPVQQSFTVYPKLPDFIVQQVTSAQVLIAPKDTVALTWKVGNVGRAASAINWTERIYMQSPTGANRTLLKQITYTDSSLLDTGSVVLRGTTVTIPAQLNVGDSGVFVVEVVPGNTVQEVPGTQANNTSVQQTPWSIKKMLTLLLSDHRITEGAATGITATVNRTGSLSNPLIVTITLRQLYRYTIPSTITIPVGQAGAAFTILATDNTTVEGTIKDTITVAALGFQSAVDTLSVLDNDNAILSFISLPSQAIEGDTVVFRVVTSLAPANPLPVYLTSGNQARFPVPPSVTIPKDSFSAKVIVVLPQNTIPEVNTTVHIAAGAANHRPTDTTIALLDDDLPNLELLLQTNTVSESAGLYATQATLRRTTASNLLPFTANLSTNIPNTLTLPASISLAAGETQKSFMIGVVDNNIVDSLRPVVITASVFVSSCGCSAPPASAGSVSATLNVSDNDGPSLTLTATPQTLPEGSTNAGMLRVSRNTSTTDSLLVNLSSSNTSEAILPTTVTIPAGQTFVNVPVATVNDGIADGNQTVFFYANASGFSQGTAWAVVTDLNKPDLLIASASVNNSSIPAKAIFTYQLSVKNAGSVTAAPNGVIVRGYLSQDTIIDNSDSIISNDIINAPISAGQTVQVMNAITAPERSGQYHLLFQVNPALTITEFVTTNNTSVPINLNIIPDYTVTANVNPLYFLKGTTVPVTGLATKMNGTPAANKQVEVFVITNGLRRKLFATTDSTGHYTAQFIPLTNEAGHYTVGASYPNINDITTQDAFDILGISINNGTVPQLRITLGDTLAGSLSIKNVSSKSLTNFSLVPVSLPSGTIIRFDTIAMLTGNGTAIIHYTVTGSSLSPGNNFEVATFKAISTEGAIQNADIYYFCQAPNGYVEASISNINVKVSQTAGERLVEFKLVNKGIGATGNITVNLPQVSWLTSVTPKTLSSLATGDSATVILKFIALAEVPFGYPVTGNIGIRTQNGNSITIPFVYEKVSVTTGTIKITVTDQFTYFAAGSPKVKGALVKIKNAFSGVVYAQGYTDSTGVFMTTGIPEGTHRISVEKDKHLPYNNTITINPGDTIASTVFINYQAITFSWNVVPTSVQDQYTVTLTTQFETNVPMPVVKIDMPKEMPALTGNQTYPFNVTLTNYGLITAKEVSLYLPDSDPEYEFVTNYEKVDLLAQQSIQVPVIMRRRGQQSANVTNGVSTFLGAEGAAYKALSQQGTQCHDVVTIVYKYDCNVTTGLWERGVEMFRYTSRVCSTSGGAYDPETGIFNPGGLYGLLITFFSAYGGPIGNPFPTIPCFICPELQPLDPNNPPRYPEFKNEKKSCQECINDIAGAVAGCTGANFLTGFGICANGVFISKGGFKDYLGCGLEGLLPPQIGCPYGILGALKTCLSTQVATAQKDNRQVGARVTANDPLNSVFQEIANNIESVLKAYEVRNRWGAEYVGNLIYSDAWANLQPLLNNYLVSLDSIRPNAQGNILYEAVSYNIPQATLQAFFIRWNTSLHARSQNILEPNVLYPDIINWSKVKAYSDSLIDIHNLSVSKGFQSIDDMYRKSYESLVQILDQQSQAVCASVSVQFSQQLTMTREAFEGTLKIFNGHPTDAMDSLSVNIQVTDQNGVPSNGLFEIQTTSLDSLANITGTGVINAQATGSVKFLFIPEVGAAPQAPTVYNFGGSVRYWDPYVGAMTTFPLASVPITVNPSPNLMLHYFMERNILGDDALTSPDIEPSIPAELAVMVENQGYGSAVNLSVSSAQPKIVDNEKGLAINFELIGSNFQGQPKNLGVTNINFGTIPALQTRIGQWYFTSSLLGKFVSYQADVVHNNSFNNPELSLVKGLKLHELTKSIKEYGPTGDNINDFLVNDIFDINDAPDIIYFSQGMRTAKVYPAATGNFSAPVGSPSFTNTLTITASDTGWNYIKLPDPGNRLYDLVSVTRSDGQVIPLDNAWLSFVTLPVSRSPIYENKFHFVDSFRSLSPVTYTVVWKPKNLNVPKIDSITGVPAQTVFTPVQNLKVVFNKAIDPATFTYQDLTLTFQGGPNIMDSSAVITRIDSLTFEVDLSALTTGNGLYTFTAQAANVMDVYGISGSVGKQTSWSQFLTVPTVQSFQGIPESHKAAAFNTIQMLFNLPINVATVTPQRFSITKNGVVQSGILMIDSVRADHKLFYLSGLNTILTQTGDYVLTVDLPNIQAANTNFGTQSQPITLTLDNTGPVLLSLAKSDSGAIEPQHFPFVNMRFDEDVTGFNTAALQLTRNGQVLPLAITQLSNTDFKNWTAGNFGMLTYPEGNYTFTVKMDSLRDAAGNEGTGSQQISWTVDRSALIVSTPVITPNKGFSNTDGITSGETFQVAFQVSDSVSQINVYQYDLSGETLLSVLPAAPAGTITAPVTLTTGGNTGIRIKATGVNGRTGTGEKNFFADQVALTAQWLFADGQTITRQPDTIAVAFSSKLRSDTGMLSAIRIEKNGVLLLTNGLSYQRMNDTLYYIKGFRQLSSASGTYQLSLQLQPFEKYSSGRRDSGSVSVTWNVQTINHAPIANAGNDIVLPAPGTVTLNGVGSSDPDGDIITYQWIAPAGITLSDSTSPTPTFTVPANHGLIYSFLLIVSDGSSFTTDVVNVSLIPSACPGSDNYFTMAKLGDEYTYQWQVDSTGSGFVNLLGNSIHSGINTDTLYLHTPSTSMYGYKYKCIAKKGSFTVYSTIYTLKFVVSWKGLISAAWENPANWSCGVLPDENTDVIINSKVPNATRLNSNGVCRSLTLSNGAVFTVSAGYNLDVKGK